MMIAKFLRWFAIFSVLDLFVAPPCWCLGLSARSGGGNGIPNFGMCDRSAHQSAAFRGPLNGR